MRRVILRSFNYLVAGIPAAHDLIDPITALAGGTSIWLPADDSQGFEEPNSMECVMNNKCLTIDLGCRSHGEVSPPYAGDRPCCA